MQVTFSSQDIGAHAICAAIGELGYGAEVVEVHPASRERRVARIQVMLHPIIRALDLRISRYSG